MKGFDGREVSVKPPFVVDELCNGCGIGEKVCQLEGEAAIEVFAVKDKTPLKELATVVVMAAPVEVDPYK